MPGSITLRPIEAKLTHNTSLLSKMDPYCNFIIGEQVFQGPVCKKGGQNPHWEEAVVTVPYNNEREMSVEVMDKDKLTSDDYVASVSLDLSRIESTLGMPKWYPLTYQNMPAGEILLQASYSDKPSSVLQSEGKDILSTKPSTIVKGTTVTEDTPLVEGKTFTEQKQVVEPRTFVKEVDVVETKEATKTIEVMEPTKVTKEVECTETIPVTKEVEVTEPIVVKKQVEVMEPQVVEKTVKVVENVPVTKEVEVVENVTRTEQIETMEPHTYTKPVEVIEQVPVQKEVTVTEPVHLKKAVECVEPVTTTQTITKEIKEPVVVGEKVTTTVGPATVIGESEPYGEVYAHWSQLSEEERLLRVKEYRRLKGIGLSDAEIEKELESKGWIDLKKKKVGESSVVNL